MKFTRYAYLILLLATLTGCSDREAEPGRITAAPAPDAAAVEANNRAVGLMGRFEYAEAQAAFSELVEQWPGWHDVRVNLAIATLNRQGEGDEARALALAREVLDADPGNLRARYVAGLVQLYLGETAAALEDFRIVAEGDPEDAYAAYYTAQSMAQLGEHEQAISWFEMAMQLDPYLRSAYYGTFQTLQRLQRVEEARELAAVYQRLENNPRSRLAEFKYTRMGPKATAVTTDEGTAAPPALPDGPLFAKPEPVTFSGEMAWSGQLPGRAPAITVADMQGDGYGDLYLAGAIGTPGETFNGNLVLRGHGDGRYEPQHDHPLSLVSDVNAALWGDYDNDGRTDVYLCRDGANMLWRQTGPDTWEDVTAATGTAGADLDTVDGAFFDADHDGDLDLFLVNAAGPNELFSNNLDGTFRPLAADYGLAGPGSGSIAVLPADLDSDRDADLVVLHRDAPHEVFLNDRMWSYHAAPGYEAFNETPALAVLAADLDADGIDELYTIAGDGELLRWRSGADGALRADTLATPALLREITRAQLAIRDFDGDGTPDLAVSSQKGWAVLRVAPGGTETLYEAPATPEGPLAAAVPLLGAEGRGPGMLAYSGSQPGLTLWAPGPGRHPFVTLNLSGRQDDAQSMRSNASGIGTQVAVRTGSRWSLLQTYRNHSGPGQGLQPLSIGLGGAQRADFVAIDWSDGVFQSEIDVPAGALQSIAETQRQLSSCPVLFAWNGTEYAFVSDILGVGGVGYAVGPGQYTTPRPRESFLLPDGLLQPRDGRYELKIGEPMEEIAYLDAARLVAYDLPEGWRMVLDERMGISAPEPTGEAVFYRREIQPAAAFNDRGDDVLQDVLVRDGHAAPVGELDARFIGRLQGEHVLTLEFAVAIDSQPGSAVLVGDGWVEYPYSQTNFAAWQAGAAFDAPTLEAFAGGQWRTVHEQFGYPAGMPRRMSLPLGNLPPGATKLRLRTNQQIYWDRIAIAYAEAPPPHERHMLQIADASVAKTGFARRSTYGQFRPDYDYSDLSPFWDTRYMAGNYTRLGPALELVASTDDAVAVIGPGEEVHLEFEALPPPRPGSRRFFVLETNGWAKDMDLFTRDGNTVGPLPTTGNPGPDRDRLHEKYNTRYQAGR